MHQNNTIHYRKKLVFYGNYFEIFDYANPLKKNYSTIKKQNDDDDYFDDIDESLQIPQNQKHHFSISRMKNTVRRIISANFETNQATFLTLTFAENIIDVKIANLEFAKFRRRLATYFTTKKLPLKYLSVTEFQRRGAVHYHVIINAPFISQLEFAKIWTAGYFRIHRIKHVKNIGAYVSKYMSKDGVDPRLYGQKAYDTSRNLIRPEAVYDPTMIAAFLAQFPSAENIFSRSIDNKYIGMVEYNQYRINGMHN